MFKVLKNNTHNESERQISNKGIKINKYLPYFNMINIWIKKNSYNIKTNMWFIKIYILCDFKNVNFVVNLSDIYVCRFIFM
jgi:hypothetical protein